MRKFLKFMVKTRMIILVVVSLIMYYMISKYQISLWYVLGLGIFMGVIFGKVFCRWMCPMGLIMEMMMSLSPDGKIKQMYQYHKVGCPIAWISGWLNRFSFFRIRFNADTCKNCGICDSKCYIVSMAEQKYSFYKAKLDNPGNSYTCSKCLKCVAACPNGSLKYKI